jgi:hypothetical protein
MGIDSHFYVGINSHSAWGSIPRLPVSNLLKQVENVFLNLLEQIWVLV